MSRHASAYHVLGLKPGADATSVDEAYRRLIKRFHPDREGGDADRAAEINQAYSELRRQRIAEASPAPRRDPVPPRRRRLQPAPTRSGPRWGVLALVAVGLLAVVARDDLAGGPEHWAEMLLGPWSPVLDYQPPRQSEATADPLEASLSAAEIERSIGSAKSLVERRDSEEIAERSRDCHRRLRDEPSAAGLDRCAAFDFAVVTLQRQDPLSDEGPFSATAVTSRQMAAAQTLSEDYLLIESRLDRVRARVEARLLPRQTIIVEMAGPGDR